MSVTLLWTGLANSKTEELGFRDCRERGFLPSDLVVFVQVVSFQEGLHDGGKEASTLCQSMLVNVCRLHLNLLRRLEASNCSVYTNGV